MATAAKWVIDPGHSKIQFKVRHLAIANVTGSFRSISGQVSAGQAGAGEAGEGQAADGRVGVERGGAGFEGAEVYLEMDAGSIDTNNAERDNHLKSELFLDAAKHPKILFRGVVTPGGDQLTGDLTILGNTRPVVLDIEHTGTGVGRFNDTRAGFEVNGKFNRRDFGLNFNLLTDVGNMVVGEEVRIIADVELISQS
jgi:polyisoprenoid-binding protein YceI